jgi:imidazolonepropionase
MRLVIKNIQELLGILESPVPFKAGSAMAEVGRISNSWLLCEGDRIADFGPMDNYPVQLEEAAGTEVIDASWRLVFPAFCDSHTHMVFPATREIEYVDKIKGLSYEEIARRGGGILNSVHRMAEVSEDQLFEEALPRLDLIRSYGTGAVEIKSGYGLTTGTELKMLRVIKRLKEHSPLTIRSTFLGAHAFPKEYWNNRRAYVEKVVHEMLPAVAGEGLADYVDVFCDKGFFSVEDTVYILEAAAKYGLVPKIHANELDFSGGVQVGVKYNALSVDHLEYTGDAEIEALRGSKTMPTLLPGAAFFLGMIDPPVRKMIDSGLPVAMASDFNPGSSPSGNMQLIWSMGCIKLRMIPEEAFNAVTLNSAYAMGVEEQLGSIARGKLANLVVTKPVPNIEYIPYAYGDNKVEMTIINGERE